MYDENNIFAKIIRGEIQTPKIYEDEYLIAINDIAPQAPIHVLIIPKNRYQDYADFVNNAAENEMSHFFKKVTDIAKSLGLENEDYRLIINKGHKAGQTIFHFHMHLLAGKEINNLI